MSYEKQGFADGQVLHAEQLAKMEDGIRNVNWDDVAAYEGVLFEATVEKSQLQQNTATTSFYYFSVPPLIIGESYNVRFNGVDYKNLICQEHEYGLFIGNPKILDPFGELDGVEPFVIDCSEDHMYSGVGINDLELESFEFSLEGKSYKTVPDKYVSGSDIARMGSGAWSSVFNNLDNEASGFYAHAEGSCTVASGQTAHAEGFSTEASSDYAHAEGYYAVASGRAAHAEGGYDSLAPVFELQTTASGDSSHAEGFHTTASEYAAHSEGVSTVASGRGAHSEGEDSTASGDYSHSEGKGTIAAGDCQHVEGYYNIEDTKHKYIHIIGNGEYSERSNAHTVDKNGNAWYAGDVEGKSMIVQSSSEGSSKRFRITVNDDGVISAEEVLETT